MGREHCWLSIIAALFLTLTPYLHHLLGQLLHLGLDKTCRLCSSLDLRHLYQA